ncbi:MAG: J domain-containing protein [Bacteroidales bacterium]|nr:J domain-containing protein [Bacteroidales bacterium]
MEYKDYYKVLGVDKNASADEIKKKYRKLAVQYHPDKNQGNKASEEKFKTVAEAYEVLGDPAKRKKYDELGSNWKQYEQAGFSGNNSDRPGFGGGQERYEEFFGGSSGFSDFFDAFFGGSGFNQQARTAAKRGRDLNVATQLSLKEAYEGTARLLQTGESTIKVPIKPGVQDGQVLRLRGKGQKGMHGGADGDLLIKIELLPDKVFTRNGDDLLMNVDIDFYTAVLGGTIIIQTLDSKKNIPIKAETQNGSVLRLKGLGMPVFGKNEHGNLLVKVNIIIPEKISQEEKALIAKAAAIRG